MKKVKIKDYKKDIHELKVALNMVGFRIEYEDVDLLKNVLNKLEEKGSSFSLEDATILQCEHERKWDEYFEKQKQEF